MNIYLKYKKIKGILFFGTISLKRAIRRILGKSFFYVIGDSHVLCFQHEIFKIYHVGPSTAYRLNFTKSTTQGRQKVISILNNIYKDKPINVIFSFGELDARIHINKAVNEKKISSDEAINDTANSYISFLKYVKKEYRLINPYVYNILPQGEEENIYKFPFYASKEKRTRIAQKLNIKLKKMLLINKFKFIYIYDNLVDKNGERKKKYVFDDVHFNRKIIPFVIKEINSLETLT